MILGLAKSGTRTICHALNELGIRAYHSEDSVFHVVLHAFSCICKHFNVFTGVSAMV